MNHSACQRVSASQRVLVQMCQGQGGGEGEGQEAACLACLPASEIRDCYLQQRSAVCIVQSASAESANDNYANHAQEVFKDVTITITIKRGTFLCNQWRIESYTCYGSEPVSY
jgi:hypothetical protein